MNTGGMMKAALIFSLTALVSLCAHSTPPTPQEVEALLTSMKSESQVPQMQAQMDAVMQKIANQTAAERNFDTPQKERFSRQMANISKITQEEISWANMKPMLVKIYTENFTQEEVIGLTNFYRSPIGSAVIDKMPIVVRQSTEHTMSRMQVLVPKLKAAIEEAAAQESKAK